MASAKRIASWLSGLSVKRDAAFAVATIIAGGVAALVIGLYGTGHADDSDSPRAAHTSSFTFPPPPGWQERAPVPTIPGLPLRDAAAYARPGAEQAELVVGRSDARTPQLLPATFLGRVATLGAGHPEKLVQGPALRYERVEVEGLLRRLRIHAMPTDAAVVTVVCFEPRSGERVHDWPGDACDRVAANIDLRALLPGTVGPSRGYANALTAILRPLRAERQSARARLAGARTRSAQARECRRLRDAYRHVLAAMGKADMHRYALAVQAVNGRLHDGLARAANAYGDMAAAADSGRSGAFRTGARDVQAAEAEIDRVLTSGMEKLGYALPRSERPTR